MQAEINKIQTIVREVIQRRLEIIRAYSQGVITPEELQAWLDDTTLEVYNELTTKDNTKSKG